MMLCQINRHPILLLLDRVVSNRMFLTDAQRMQHIQLLGKVIFLGFSIIED